MLVATHHHCQIDPRASLSRCASTRRPAVSLLAPSTTRCPSLNSYNIINYLLCNNNSSNKLSVYTLLLLDYCTAHNLLVGLFPPFHSITTRPFKSVLVAGQEATQTLPPINLITQKKKASWSLG